MPNYRSAFTTTSNITPSSDSVFSSDQNEASNSGSFFRSTALNAILKIIFSLFILVGVTFLSYAGAQRLFGSGVVSEQPVILQARYRRVLWKNLGYVFEPVVKIPLYYPDSGFVEKEFLVDSGAVISSLPREEAKNRGISLAKLPRTAFAGYGGTLSFAYKSKVGVKLGNEKIELPVVFTEAHGTKRILGRAGFFERYSVLFNRKTKRVEIFK